MARLRAEGVEIRHFPYSASLGRRGESWGISRALARWLKRNYRNFDLIHCHGAWQMVTLLTACRAGGGPRVILTPHESMTNFDLAHSSSSATGTVKRLLRRYYARRFDLFVLASQLEARDSLRADNHGSPRTTVVPHPIFDETAVQPAPNTKKPFSSGLALGYLGRLHAKKNVGVILQAMRGTDENITLSVAGGGAEFASLKALSASLGLDHRVTWSGFVDGDRKLDFLHDINVLLMPSEYESFGMAAAEAMSHGVPVIVSPQTGIAEIIHAQGGGDIVAPEADALRVVIENLSRNPDKIVELGIRAAAAAHNSLSFAAYGATMMHHYESLLADRKTT
jgi:glycosyltransferase involved in cell wall biosynthesis